MINSDGGKRREGLRAETLYGARQSLAPADTEAKRFRAQRTSGTKEGSVWCVWGTVWRGWSSGICGRTGLAGLKVIIPFNILANDMCMAIIRCPILWLMGHKDGQVDRGRSFTHPLYASHLHPTGHQHRAGVWKLAVGSHLPPAPQGTYMGVRTVTRECPFMGRGIMGAQRKKESIWPGGWAGPQEGLTQGLALRLRFAKWEASPGR